MPPAKVDVSWTPGFHAMAAERAGVVLGLVEPAMRVALEAALRRNRAPDRIDRAFTSPFVPSRYTDGTFAAFYAAEDATTALKEKLHHDANWLRTNGVGRHLHAVQLLHVTVQGDLEDVRPLAAKEPDLRHPTDYAACQLLAHARHAAGADGLLYPSVRDPDFPCAAIFARHVVSAVAYHKTVTVEWTGAEFIDSPAP